MAQWLTVKQLAQHLQVSEAKVYSLARGGRLPASKVDNQWRFDQEAVDSWLAANVRRSPTAST
jgi:excisionase family DNA binding protein